MPNPSLINPHHIDGLMIGYTPGSDTGHLLGVSPNTVIRNSSRKCTHREISPQLWELGVTQPCPTMASDGLSSHFIVSFRDSSGRKSISEGSPWNPIAGDLKVDGCFLVSADHPLLFFFIRCIAVCFFKGSAQASLPPAYKERHAWDHPLKGCIRVYRLSSSH